MYCFYATWDTWYAWRTQLLACWPIALNAFFCLFEQRFFVFFTFTESKRKIGCTGRHSQLRVVSFRSLMDNNDFNTIKRPWEMGRALLSYTDCFLRDCFYIEIKNSKFVKTFIKNLLFVILQLFTRISVPFYLSRIAINLWSENLFLGI